LGPILAQHFQNLIWSPCKLTTDQERRSKKNFLAGSAAQNFDAHGIPRSPISFKLSDHVPPKVFIELKVVLEPLNNSAEEEEVELFA
jgi:hypothetical protein